MKMVHEQGYKDARIYECKGVIRVVCGRFDTEAEAYRQVNKMNTKEEFYEAWVYKKVESWKFREYHEARSMP